ncbi:MAG TPA: inositol monophosphatase family protein [Candidatus Bathyarchaeia archaeon]|nr:inositol monophosphatase family protein [Candidatus Bathyarchaeia archaeon]
MKELASLLFKLDKIIVNVYKENLNNQEAFSKTDFSNAAGHKSRVIDLIMEDTIINFFKNNKFPCIIETEERGKISLSNNPKYVVITDPLDGTTNFSRRIPLTSYGIAIAKLENELTQAKFSDIVVAAVRSFHTDEFYFASKHEGATCNNEKINPSEVNLLNRSLISFDLDGSYKQKEDLIEKIMLILRKCRGTRRFGANLIDMVYVGAGKIEVMIDIRDTLSAVHTPSLFISKESGAVLRTIKNEEFNIELEANQKMSFILCNNEQISRQIFETIR